MAQDYSYSELMQMQDKAIERVREMQERARRTVEENPIEGIDEPPPREEEKPEEIFPPKIKSGIPKSGIPLGINMDKDKATVLPLLLLLMKEGADSLLLLALIYIMA